MSMTMNISNSEGYNVIPYNDIFTQVETALKNQSGLSQADFTSRFDSFKHYENQDLSDADYFDLLTAIIYYSGFKAETVSKKIRTIKNHFSDFNAVSEYSEAKISQIMQDSKMIKNEKKIRACINNAKLFKAIVNDLGSFKNYIDTFNVKESFENLMLFKEEIQYKFDYLGPITAYHFMTDMGLSVLKPDRVITRIFKRIGLIENEEQLLKTVIHGRKFSQETGLPIRYIDIIFVKYGQMGKDESLGINDGICLEKNPKCHLCRLGDYCDYAKR